MKQAWRVFGLSALVACGDSSTAPSVPDSGCPAPISLRRGEVRSFSGPAAVSCIAIGSTTEAQEYLFVAASAKPAADDLWSYQVGSALPRSSSVADRSPSAYASAREQSLERRTMEFRSAFENRLRLNERHLLGDRSIGALGRDAARDRSRRLLERNSARSVAVSPAPSPGDVVSFRVGDAASSDLCTTYTDVRAVVKAVGTRAVVAVDVTAPAHGFSDVDFRAIAAEFDAAIYPVDAQWFGTATDVNGDARITILYTPVINRLQPRGTTGFVGGFFFLSDLLPRSLAAQQWRCDASNEQEIIYLLAPDPDGVVNGNRHTVESSLESSRGTLAHELQHMINQGARQTVTHADRLEVTWLNEGLSHFAEEAVGRASRGYGDYRRLSWKDVLVELDDFDSFFRQNLLRLRYWMERPDLASPVSSATATQLAPRGAAWALVRHTIDQYSRGDAKAFVRALVAGPEVDVRNLEARSGVSFDEMLPGFLLANVDGVAASGAAARYTTTSWDFADVMTNLNGGVHPLRVVPLPAQSAAQSPAASASYFTLSQPASAPVAQYRMRSANGGPVVATDARVYLLRVR